MQMLLCRGDTLFFGRVKLQLPSLLFQENPPPVPLKTGIQLGLMSFHGTKALYEERWVILWKITRGQLAVILLQLYIPITLSRLSTPPLLLWWFADIFITPAAHSMCFRVLLWGADVTALPLTCPHHSWEGSWVSWILRLISPRSSRHRRRVYSFHNWCRCFCAGETLSSSDEWSYNCPPCCSRKTLLLFHLKQASN